jgi:hypothetical protein
MAFVRFYLWTFKKLKYRVFSNFHKILEKKIDYFYVHVLRKDLLIGF